MLFKISTINKQIGCVNRCIQTFTAPQSFGLLPLLLSHTFIGISRYLFNQMQFVSQIRTLSKIVIYSNYSAVDWRKVLLVLKVILRYGHLKDSLFGQENKPQERVRGVHT